MKFKKQPITAIEIGNVKISMLDEEERERFMLGLLDNCKQFFKDPKNLAEYNDWQKTRKLNRASGCEGGERNEYAIC